MAIKYWLFKTEESVYSINDLSNEPEQITHWEGIRNYQARNFIRDDMKIGDRVLFYHSNSDPNAVVGICEIVREAYPDFFAFDKKSKYYDPKSKEDEPTWLMVDVKLVDKFNEPVTLKEIKANPKLSEMRLVQRGNRLSVFPVEKKEFDEILNMAK
jgi:predicted RNA-binding protein with PUA-like domain